MKFDARYAFRHPHAKQHRVGVGFSFPASQAIYDDFRFQINGREGGKSAGVEQGLSETALTGAGAMLQLNIHYLSQGMDSWVYQFGDGVSRVRDFSLAMTTDFDRIDFPIQSLSPTRKTPAGGGKGWKLDWDYKSLVFGFQIGMVMPEKLNPGPLAARLSFFAPFSLLFFFFMVFVITVVHDIRLHPMHYLFVGASFFAFHLLFAYLADHLLPASAFLICTAVSVGLVVSYLRIVTSARFALVYAGLAQAVYLVLFSYAFFFEGYTGLAITVLAILSLFLVMQFTARVNWEEKLQPGPAVIAE